VEAAQAYDREAIQRRRLAACTNFDFIEYPDLFCAPGPACVAACAHVTMNHLRRKMPFHSPFARRVKNAL
jgi:hypothetical protein